MFKRKKKLKELRLELEDKKMFKLVEKMCESNLAQVKQIGGVYYAIDNVNSCSISLSPQPVLKIANHDYTIQRNISTPLYNKLSTLFREALDREQESIEKELYKNEIELINKITKNYE